MCNTFVLSLVPTIICVCHSGTDVFSGDHVHSESDTLARARESRTKKDARIERQPRPRRMDDGLLAYANKAEAGSTS